MANWQHFGATWLNLDMVAAWWTFTDVDGRLAITVQFGLSPELIARLAMMTGASPERVTQVMAPKISETRQFFGADAQALLPLLQTARGAVRRKDWPPGLTRTA